MLFYLFAFSLVAAFASFISGYALEIYALDGLAHLLFVGGAFFLSATYTTILLALSLCGVCDVVKGIRRYLSETESSKRKVLFVQRKTMDLEQRHRLEKQQINYHLAHQRRHIIRDNDKKHIGGLADSIAESLAILRDTIPASTLRSLEKSLHKNLRTNNVEGLLKLYSEIMSFR